jgi:hypothetical protein
MNGYNDSTRLGSQPSTGGCSVNRDINPVECAPDRQGGQPSETQPLGACHWMTAF